MAHVTHCVHKGSASNTGEEASIAGAGEANTEAEADTNRAAQRTTIAHNADRSVSLPVLLLPSLATFDADLYPLCVSVSSTKSSRDEGLRGKSVRVIDLHRADHIR